MSSPTRSPSPRRPASRPSTPASTASSASSASPPPTPPLSPSPLPPPLRPASPEWQLRAQEYLRTHSLEFYPALRPPSPQWQLEAVDYCRMHVEPLDVPIAEISAPDDHPLYPHRSLHDRLRAARRTIHDKRLYLHRAMERCENGFVSDGSTPGQHMRDYYDRLSQWDNDLQLIIRTDEENDRRSVEIEDLLYALTAALLQLNHLRRPVGEPAPAPRTADWW